MNNRAHHEFPEEELGKEYSEIKLIDRKNRPEIYYGQLIQPKDDKHHIIPASIVAKEINNLEKNMVIVNSYLHERFHTLFLNRSPEEILDLLVNYFWGGKIGFVENFLLLNSNGGNGSTPKKEKVAGGSVIKVKKHKRYQHIFENQLDLPKDDIHHIIPLSRGGTEDPKNTVKVSPIMRDKYHRGLFLDRIPEEVLGFLVNYFWNGEINFVKNYLFIKNTFNCFDFRFLTEKRSFPIGFLL
ncbi:MAG: HNH endonuclease [Patescibacteria group bacterium]